MSNRSEINGLSAYRTARKRWEKQVEDIAIEMLSLRNDEGLALVVHPGQFIDSFISVCTEIEQCLQSSTILFFPGDVENETDR